MKVGLTGLRRWVHTVLITQYASEQVWYEQNLWRAKSRWLERNTMWKALIASPSGAFTVVTGKTCQDSIGNKVSGAPKGAGNEGLSIPTVPNGSSWRFRKCESVLRYTQSTSWAECCRQSIWLKKMRMPTRNNFPFIANNITHTERRCIKSSCCTWGNPVYENSLRKKLKRRGEISPNVTSPEDQVACEEGKLSLVSEMGYQELINQTTIFYQDFSDKDKTTLLNKQKKWNIESNRALGNLKYWWGRYISESFGIQEIEIQSKLAWAKNIPNSERAMAYQGFKVRSDFRAKYG